MGRSLTLIAASLAMLAFVGGTAVAQDKYPSRPVELFIPFTPGGAFDTHARILAEQLSKQLGVAVVPVNKPGASGNLAAELVAKSKPDGYTLLYISSSLTINPSLYKSLNYDVLSDFTPISFVGAGVMSIVVSPGKHPDVKTAADLREMMLKPGANISYSSGGIGNTSHLAAMLFVDGIKAQSVVHVPFSGGTEAITSVMSGETDFSMQSISATRGLVADGKLRAIAVTTKDRSSVLPDVPTIAETVIPGFDVSSWHGVVAPAGLPNDILTRLNTEIATALKTPSVRDAFLANATQPMSMSPDEFKAYIRDEVTRWADILKKAGIQKQ
jgi:tripartite-type tricarboxylate transporter receptor subunit TctC